MWSLSDLKLDSPALCIIFWEYLLICIFCCLFRPVENPADDVLCIEVWYVPPSVQFLHFVGSIFARYKAAACSYYQLQLLNSRWFYLLWSTIKLKVFMVDIQHYKISSACECLGFYSDANNALFSGMWYCITRHMVPDILTQLTGLVLVFKGQKVKKDETTMSSQNVKNQIVIDTVSHPRRTDTSSSVSLLCNFRDFDPAETVREKMMKLGEVKGVKGLRKLMKEIAVTASTGKHDNELVGSATLPLKVGVALLPSWGVFTKERCFAYLKIMSAYQQINKLVHDYKHLSHTHHRKKIRIKQMNPF